MSVSTVLGEVEANGIALRLDGERVRIWFPEPQQRERLAEQIAFLRAHREEVTKFLLTRDRATGARPPYFWGADRNGKARDYYGWRANIALDALCKIPAQEGLVVWLAEYSPFLYRRLTCDLPNKVSRAWNDRVSREKFDVLCFDLVDTYRGAAELYGVRNQRLTVQRNAKLRNEEPIGKGAEKESS
jgi:hypothetical protein